MDGLGLLVVLLLGQSTAHLGAHVSTLIVAGAVRHTNIYANDPCTVLVTHDKPTDAAPVALARTDGDSDTTTDHAGAEHAAYVPAEHTAAKCAANVDTDTRPPNGSPICAPHE